MFQFTTSLIFFPPLLPFDTRRRNTAGQTERGAPSRWPGEGATVHEYNMFQCCETTIVEDLELCFVDFEDDVVVVEDDDDDGEDFAEDLPADEDEHGTDYLREDRVEEYPADGAKAGMRFRFSTTGRASGSRESLSQVMTRVARLL